MDTSQQHSHAPTPHPGFLHRAAIPRYAFMRVRMEFGRNKIFFNGRSKVENDRTKLIVLGQIVHALFISNFILCTILLVFVLNCMMSSIQIRS